MYTLTRPRFDECSARFLTSKHVGKLGRVGSRQALEPKLGDSISSVWRRLGDLPAHTSAVDRGLDPPPPKWTECIQIVWRCQQKRGPLSHGEEWSEVDSSE